MNAIWPRIIALVAEPGVEFDHTNVIDYQPAKASALSQMVENYETLIFEAHSTDYQTPQSLRQLVIDHFAILKVGPALTFALRRSSVLSGGGTKNWCQRKPVLVCVRCWKT